MVSLAPLADSGIDSLIRTPRAAVSALYGEDEIGFDIETSGLSPFRNQIAVISLSGKRSGKNAVLHVRGEMPDVLKEFFQDPSRTFVGHNVAQFDALFMHQAGVDVFRAKWFDTMIAELAILVSGRRDHSVSLKASMERRTGVRLRKQIDHGSWMNDSLTEEQLEYASGDVSRIHDLKTAQLERARELKVESAVDLEMAIIPTVMRLTLNGLPWNEVAYRAFVASQSGIRAEAEAALFAAFGGPINLNSPLQLKKALGELGIELNSTAAAVLLEEAQGAGIHPDDWTIEQLSDLWETQVPGSILGVLLKHRHANQRLKMYTEDWTTKHVHQGRVHARFWQLGTDPGRFSSSEPNLQQLPRDMRKWDEPGIVQAPQGDKIVSSDFDQIEVRVMAHLAQDEALLEACAAGDIHAQIAAECFEVAPSDLTVEQRKDSKANTFCKLFGGGADTSWRYARNNGSQISRDDMHRVFARFDQRFRGVRRMIDNAYYVARNNDRVVITLPTGLKRVLVGDLVKGSRILNTRVQGAAAAGMKYSLLECQHRGLDQYLGATVHDELVGTVPESQAKEYSAELTDAMVTGMHRVLPESVKVTASPKIGRWWGHDEEKHA